MNLNDNDDSRPVALYWGFENLHAGLLEAKYGKGAYAKQDNRFKVQEPLIDVQALVELALRNRAANMASRYATALRQFAAEATGTGIEVV